MNEIHKIPLVSFDCWTSIVEETDPRVCGINQNIRKKLLFSDNDDNIFLKRYVVTEWEDGILCLCGFHIKYICIVECGISGEFAIIGSNCLKKYYPKRITERLREIKRKTFKCEFCLKRVSKENHICFEKEKLFCELSNTINRNLFKIVNNIENKKKIEIERLKNKCSRAKCNNKKTIFKNKLMVYCKECWTKRKRLEEKGKLPALI